MGAYHNLSRWRSYIRSLSWWSRAKEDLGLSHKWNPKRMYGFNPEISRVLFRLELCKEGDSNLLKIEAPYPISFKWEVISKQDYQSREESIYIPSHFSWWSAAGRSCYPQIITKWGFWERNEDTLKLWMDGSDKDQGFAKQRNSSMKTNSLYQLDPFLESHGILHLGGRIKCADVPYDLEHLGILPKKSHITKLIIRHYHHQVEHQGQGITLNSLQSSGYWVVGGTSVVGNRISKCVVCRKLHGPVSEQKMADLPDDRLEPSPSFTYCEVDYSGPWLIKEGWGELKRYECYLPSWPCVRYISKQPMS